MKQIFHKTVLSLKNTPKRRYLEVLVVGIAVFVIIAAANAISPYKPAPSNLEVSFLSDDQTHLEQNTPGARYRAKVISVQKNDTMQVELLDGDHSGQAVSANYVDSPLATSVGRGDVVLLTEQPETGVLFYTDRYRIPALAVVTSIFVALVLLIGRRRGVSSLIGLGLGLIIIGWGIVPLILTGYNAFWVCFVGALLIAAASVFMSHGFKSRTVVSVACILLVLMVVAAGSVIALWLTGLTGIETDESSYMTVFKIGVDMRGLLAGGIIIATLGALDDVVTTQVAVVDELYGVDKNISVGAVYKRALSVGREHIAALVNTLVLAYAGASLPLIVSMMQPTGAQGGWLFALNGDLLATEIVRTLVASSALVIAVPISSLAAALVLRRKKMA